MKKFNLNQMLKNSFKALLVGVIAVSSISAVYAGSCILVATSNLHIPHNGNVYSVKRTFSKQTQVLSYSWQSIEPKAESTTEATLIVKLCTKDFWGNYNPVQTKNLNTNIYSTSDQVQFTNSGSGKYYFWHSTYRPWNNTLGKFDSDNVLIYTQD